MRFRAGQRLRRQGDFQHVRTRGRRFDCGAFVFWHAPRLRERLKAEGLKAETSPSEADAQSAGPAPVSTLQPSAFSPSAFLPARLGVVASRAAVGNAVARNRAKRRLREAFRRHQELVPPGQDVLLVARRAINHAVFDELEKRFVGACRKLFAPPAPLPDA
ncbi:MAG: ribonuclease P protein component [Opitutaceae bacterium]|jgi:ribonuclease P protein component|nr:ribonuclease P protein component [Opitutaceae bacterium]